MKRSKTLLKRCIALLLGILVLGVVVLPFTGIFTPKKEETTPPPPLPDAISLGLGSTPKTVLENDRYTLAISPVNMGVTVTDTVRGTVWNSNPEGDMSIRSAQFSLSYVDTRGNYALMDSYTDSVEKMQATVHKGEDCVYVKYLLGDYELTGDILPKNINAAKFQKRILDKLNEEEREEMQKYYRFYESENIWGLTSRGYINFERVYEMMQQVGYTDTDIADDNVEFGVTQSALNKAHFTMVLKYTLTSQGFTVEMPTAYIEKSEGYYPYKVTLFELFGTATAEDSGYMLIPDGSGALVPFRDVTGSKEKLSLPVYGHDMTVSATADLVPNSPSERVTLPVFGMKKNTEGYLAVIEDGAATAYIETYQAGSQNKYNAVYPVFTVYEKDNVYLEGSQDSTKIPQFQRTLYDGSFRVQYLLLDAEDNGYNEMAAALREYYTEAGVLKKLQNSAVPFYLETIGGVTGYKNLLGVSYTGVVSATSYADNVTILEAVKEAGIDDVRLILNGWFNGGVYHSFPKNIKLLSQLGGKRGLNELLEYAAEEGVQLYPQVNTMTVDRKGNGFWSLRHSARTLDLLEAEVATRSFATGQDLSEDDIAHAVSYILRPTEMVNVTKKFLKAYAKYDINGLYLSSAGNELYSDFLQSDTIDRNASVKHSVEGLAAVKEQLGNVMINQGNSYALPYATDILNVASESSGYQMTTTDVPFLQMVLHSYVNMAGTPINLAADSRVAALKALEYGMGLHYQVTYEPSFVLKNTNYSQNYASHYEAWLPDMQQQYTTMKPLLEQVQTADMVRHDTLAEQVYATTYDNGCRIIVNYSDAAYTVGETTVEPMGFALVKEGERIEK